MRQLNVSHLGQIDIAILEISGEMSLYFYEDKDVLYGLPILPNLFKKQLCVLPIEAHYSCSYCGFTEIIAPKSVHICKNCKHDKWITSINSPRIT